jgi:alpha-ketoglutarate-dependent taurine dioxygenase
MPESTSYENIPSDYIAMKMVKTPRTGGDTLFASCYGAYDRLSEPWQRLADSLSCTSIDICKRKKANSQHNEATHHEPDIMPLADKGIKLWLGPRGHPDNVGGSFQARQ